MVAPPCSRPKWTDVTSIVTVWRYPRQLVGDGGATGDSRHHHHQHCCDHHDCRVQLAAMDMFHLSVRSSD